MANLVSLKEIKYILEGFAKKQSSSLDGKIMEFFSEFYDLEALELLFVVEEPRIQGHVARSLNANFIALIPKCDKPKTFNDFKPISLCNLVYKIIMKVISNHSNPMLSTFLTKEKCSCLDDH